MNMNVGVQNPYACPKCNGTGVEECYHCGQDMDCESCDGSKLDGSKLDMDAYNLAINKLLVASGHRCPRPWVEDGVQLGMQTDQGKVAFADHSHAVRIARYSEHFAADAAKLEWKQRTVGLSMLIGLDYVKQHQAAQVFGPYAVSDEGKLHHVPTGFVVRVGESVNEAKALAYHLHAAGYTPCFEDWDKASAENKKAIKQSIDYFMRYEPLKEKEVMP